MVRSFYSFLIVFHAIQLVCVILADVITSSHLLFFSSIILSISVFSNFKVPLSKGLFNEYLLYQRQLKV